MWSARRRDPARRSGMWRCCELSACGWRVCSPVGAALLVLAASAGLGAGLARPVFGAGASVLGGACKHSKASVPESCGRARVARLGTPRGQKKSGWLG